MTAYEQFDAAERLEDLAGRIYRRLAGHFAADEAARALFARLADEEDQHRLRIQMLRTRYLRRSPGVSAVRLDPGVVAGAVEAGERCDAEFARSAPASIGEALQVAVELEERFAAVHAEALTRDCDADVRELFEMLASQDRLHAQLLRAARS